MTTRSRYFVRFYGEEGAELDSEEVIGGAFKAAIQALIGRVVFDVGDFIRIEADEIDD